MPTRNPVIRVAIAVLLSLFAAGCGRETVAQGPPPAADPEVGVAVIEPQRVSITAELAGRTAPYLVAEIRPQVSGIIQKRLFREGAEVKPGELLYQIDPGPYQAAVDSARAALARAQASLVPVRLKAERYRDLIKGGAISKQDYDDAQAAFQQAEANVAASRAALDAAAINQAYTRVSSPIPGRIGRSSVTQGALVTANQTGALAVVQQLDPIYVDVTQSSLELLRLKHSLASGRLKRSGDDRPRVRLLLEDGTAYSQEGTLQLSETTVDQDTGTVTLRAVFPNPGHDLLPGMYVRAIIEEGMDEAAILAPQQAVSRDAKGNAVAMVVAEGNKVEARPLRVERALGDKWLVAEGLRSGDRIIVEGLQKVRPGITVRLAQPAGEK